MAPIRVGLIGLTSLTGEISASPGDSWAVSAHLPYLLASPHYELTALCNSSEKSAKAAVKRHGLPESTKTYGNPADLAKDPDVDLVVCSVRVDRHYAIMKPVLEAGKDVFVEWPLGSNLAQAEEMLAIAKKSGSKTIVGLQARSNPFIQKVRDLVEKKAIGDLLSSTATLEFGFADGYEPPGCDYMAKKEVGGNVHTIIFGHIADPIIYSLGGRLDEVSALLTTRWPNSKLLKADGSFDRMITRETADHVMLQSTLSGSGAPLSIAVRAGKAFKDTPALTWKILGTKGQIRVTSATNLSLSSGTEKIEIYDHEKDTVEIVDALYVDTLKDLAGPYAKNIGKLYEDFATGENKSGMVTFEDAVQTHKIIDAMDKSSVEKRYVTLPK